jgi:hypothetical protein
MNNHGYPSLLTKVSASDDKVFRQQEKRSLLYELFSL